jgi:hypothetical protein
MRQRFFHFSVGGDPKLAIFSAEHENENVPKKPFACDMCSIDRSANEDFTRAHVCRKGRSRVQGSGGSRRTSEIVHIPVFDTLLANELDASEAPVLVGVQALPPVVGKRTSTVAPGVDWRGVDSEERDERVE